MRFFKTLLLAGIAIPALALSIFSGGFSDSDFRFELDAEDVEAQLIERNDA